MAGTKDAPFTTELTTGAANAGEPIHKTTANSDLLFFMLAVSIADYVCVQQAQSFAAQLIVAVALLVKNRTAAVFVECAIFVEDVLEPLPVLAHVVLR
jgi:hypothetical protein